MIRIKKICALVLVLMFVIATGIASVSAAEAADTNTVSADEATGITIHVRDDEVTQPYLYLWNSLPTNDAMSDSYPGEKLNGGANGWFDYYVADVTKVNVIVTDADGNQHSKEQIILASYRLAQGICPGPSVTGAERRWNRLFICDK